MKSIQELDAKICSCTDALTAKLDGSNGKRAILLCGGTGCLSSNSLEIKARFDKLIEAKTGSRPEKAAIISNEFHLFRAGLMAGEQGLEAIGVPAKTTWLALRVNYFLREIVAVWYYTLLGG